MKGNGCVINRCLVKPRVVIIKLLPVMVDVNLEALGLRIAMSRSLVYL
jgi:hypothetical protein